MDTKERIAATICERYSRKEVQPRRYEKDDCKSVVARIPDIATRYGGNILLVPGIPMNAPRYGAKA